jgi:hypothetical protein
MKKWLLPIVVLFLLKFNATASTGDTTYVLAHDTTHLGNHGEYNSWGVFPAHGKTFRKVLMDFKLGCPWNGCSDWDYTVTVEALHHTGGPNDTIEKIELGRCITPYGGNFTLAWNNTWVFDVTDYQDILRDSTEIRVFYDGWSDGFSLSLNFKMIEGTPPRTPLRVRNIYSDGAYYFSYGNTGDPIENHFPATTFDVDSTEKMAMMRIIPSGHGAGTANCSEFCNKSYHILVDGIQHFNQQIWRSDCGMNSLYAQAGTWIYDRANWCPGEKALVKTYELTPYITPGDSVSLDMNFDAYTNSVSGQNPGYYLSSQLITYSAPNFTLDASVDDIISPSTFFNYRRFNPVCSHPVVVIKNTGSSQLTSLDIHYGIRGGVMNTFNWTGALNFLDTQQVTLGPISWGTSTTGNNDQFEVYVSNPNGSSDEYAWNDTLYSKTDFTATMPNQIVVMFKTNNAASETTWKIRDESGSIIAQRGLPLTANTVYQDTISLASGCYNFTLFDTGKDGLSFFNNTDGTGYCRIKSATNTQIYTIFQADFGTQIGQQFTVGFSTPVEEIRKDIFFRMYPNPSNGKITMDILIPKPEDLTVSFYSIEGKKVLEKTYPAYDNSILNFDLGEKSAGIYYVCLKTNSYFSTKKLVIGQ